MSDTARIKRHYSIVAHGEDVVELRHGVWNPVSFTLTDESGTGRLYDLLSRLDGTTTIPEVARQVGVAAADVEALVDHLDGLGVVEFGPSNALDYYLDHAVPTLIGPDKPEPATTPVLLAGDAELTAAVAGLLSPSLVSHAVAEVPDDDPGWALLGEHDTDWLMDGLEFERRLDRFERWRDRLVVHATKVVNPVRLRALNRVCLALGVTWVHAALDGPFVFVGPTVVPHRSSCYECFETRVAMNLRGNESYQRYKRALVAGRVTGGEPPAQPAIAGVLAAHTSLEVVNFVLTGTTFTVNKALSIYLPTQEFAYHDVLRLPSCPACGPSPDRDDQELYFDMRAFVDQELRDG